ncbi:nucleolin 2-like [Macadamia integrifolia]|uniref:nucleolin 2-like n=1 Tax=Macadamia integrifolia TaxID=60698 RepID=UPI001C52B0E5|nr:nucleolin 2-like [Macadamia integrifolia]
MGVSRKRITGGGGGGGGGGGDDDGGDGVGDYGGEGEVEVGEEVVVFFAVEERKRRWCDGGEEEKEAPDFVKKHLSDACIQLSFHCSRVLKELAISIKTMRRSFKIDLSIGEMKDALLELQNVLNSLSTLLSTPPPSSSPVAENSEEMKNPISTPTIVSLVEREVISYPSINASRRLLQFAVREAVGTLRPSNLRTEASSKRLRSVVSTATVDSSTDEQPQRIKSVARVPNAMATAIKAAAEAAEDVVKVRCSGNVFDRLGHSMDVSRVTDQLPEFRSSNIMETGFDQTPGLTHSDYVRRHEYDEEVNGNTALLDREAELASDSASDNDGYEDINVVGHGVRDASQTGTSSGKERESLTVEYSVAKNKDEVARKKWMQDQVPPNTITNTSRKIVNISVNVNTWKPPYYQEPREIAEIKNCKAVQETQVVAGKPGAQLSKENNNIVAGNEHESSITHSQRESLKTLSTPPGSCSTGRPLEDAESRTIYVSNVHFAATKDALSRHFNKFGEILKVVIVTDAATGQPKGSAYVEFMRKEAAENALSLNGTSFMSRILKVVKRGSASQETASMMTWPRMPRASPFAARLARVPFPRGIPGAFRARPPIKSGARSLQWKRDSQSTTGGEGSASVQHGSTLTNNNVPSAARSLTYIRTGPNKPEGNSAPAPA